MLDLRTRAVRGRLSRDGGPARAGGLICDQSRLGRALSRIRDGGRKRVTLRDAGEYIAALPKAVHCAPEWRTAMEALILVAESGGPTMFARIGIMRALNRNN